VEGDLEQGIRAFADGAQRVVNLVVFLLVEGQALALGPLVGDLDLVA